MVELELRTGMRLKSVACTTEVVVVRATADAGALACGGHQMIAINDPRPRDSVLANDAADGTQMGKRYVDADDNLELLCTKAGAGSLAIDGRALVEKTAKPLPASD